MVRSASQRASKEGDLRSSARTPRATPGMASTSMVANDEEDEVDEQDWDRSAGSSSEEDDDASSNSEEDTEDGDRPHSDAESEEGEKRQTFAAYLDSDDEDQEGESDSDSKSEIATKPHAGLRRVSGNRSKPKPAVDEAEQIRGMMANVPFSALVRAQKQLAKGSHDDLDGEEPDEFEADRKAIRQRRTAHERQEIEKRQDKHAPTEMSSRRPVSRRRNVVETASHERRDPRFSSLSASASNKGLFQTSYGFLRQQQSEEVQQLKKALGALKRQERHRAGPNAQSEAALRLRQERERIEMALRREEGRENERKRREHEDAVVKTAKRAIEERVKQGGKRFYLKESEKKKLVLKDKYERLSNGGEAGGKGNRGALQKLVEKRRKRNAAKDRKIPLGGGGGAGGSSMPFARASQSGEGAGPMPKRKRITREG